MHTPSYLNLKELGVGDSYDHPYFMAKYALKNINSIYMEKASLGTRCGALLSSIADIT